MDHSLSGDSYQDGQGQYSRHHEEEEEEEEETFIHYKDNKHHRKEGRSKDSRPKRPSSQPRPGQQPPRHQKKDPRSGLSSRGTHHLQSILLQNRQDTNNMAKTRQQDQTEKENEDLRKRVQALEKENQALGKRKRGDDDEDPDPYDVIFDEDVKTTILAPIKQHIWPKWTFLANHKEEVECMTSLLKHTREWKLNRLATLSPRALRKQVENYVETYGDEMCKSINGHRNESQQKLRKVWIELYKENIRLTHKQWLKVAQRPAELLLLLPEKDKQGRKIQANIKKNQDGKVYRVRLKIWVSRILPAMAGVRNWGPTHYCNEIPSDYKVRSAGKAEYEPITSNLEGCAILFMANAEKKWIFEAQREMATGKAISSADRKEEAFKKACPATKYSTIKSGNTKYGGWYEKGRNKYRDFRFLIRQGRMKPEARAVEEQTRDALKKDLQATLPEPQEEQGRKPKISLHAGVGIEDDMEEEKQQEEYNSDDEGLLFVVAGPPPPEAAAAAAAPPPSKKGAAAGKKTTRAKKGGASAAAAGGDLSEEEEDDDDTTVGGGGD